MAKKKAKIIGAYADMCPHCGGVIFKLKTSFGILYQCKSCRCSYQNR